MFTRTTLITALGTLAVAAPAAQAVPIYEPNSGFAGAFGKETRPAQDRTVDSSFDWGSAALGAGGGILVLTVAGAGGVAVTRRSRTDLAG